MDLSVIDKSDGTSHRTHLLRGELIARPSESWLLVFSEKCEAKSWKDLRFAPDSFCMSIARCLAFGFAGVSDTTLEKFFQWLGIILCLSGYPPSESVRLCI